MKYSVDLETTIDKKAKLLLMGSCCDNCFYHDNKWRPVSIFCMRHKQHDFGNNKNDFMDFIVKEGVCNKWIDRDISKEKRQKLENYIGMHLTQEVVDKMIEILEDK